MRDALPETTAPFTAELWSALGGDPSWLAALIVTGDGDLPSAYRVSDLAVASIGVAGLAAAERVASSSGMLPSVEVDRELASAWFGSAVRPVGWTLPGVWDPLARNYRSRDGWIRLHTNAPHHRAAVLAVLGVRGDPSDVRRAVARRVGDELEREVVAAGGCAAVLRSAEDWRVHPQGAAVAAEPLLQRRRGSPSVTPVVPASPERPLEGIRVLDLTRVIAGPVATRFLAGLGAEVLRIDPPEWEEQALVPNMTLGKRAARLDLTVAADRVRLEELLAGADVIVHGYRDGALAGLGFDAEALQRIRPGLVDVSLDAYGFSGPWAQRRGFDSLVQMSVGIAHRGMGWARADEPTPLPVQALDHATGYLLAAAAIRGITRRDADGLGSVVRTSLARVALCLVEGGELPLDGPLVRRAEPTESLATPWGEARMLRSAVTIAGAPISYLRPPRDLGSDEARWS